MLASKIQENAEDRIQASTDQSATASACSNKINGKVDTPEVRRVPRLSQDVDAENIALAQEIQRAAATDDLITIRSSRTATPAIPNMIPIIRYTPHPATPPPRSPPPVIQHDVQPSAQWLVLKPRQTGLDSDLLVCSQRIKTTEPENYSGVHVYTTYLLEAATTPYNNRCIDLAFGEEYEIIFDPPTDSYQLINTQTGKTIRGLHLFCPLPESQLRRTILEHSSADFSHPSSNRPHVYYEYDSETHFPYMRNSNISGKKNWVHPIAGWLIFLEPPATARTLKIEELQIRETCEIFLEMIVSSHDTSLTDEEPRRCKLCITRIGAYNYAYVWQDANDTIISGLSYQLTLGANQVESFEFDGRVQAVCLKRQFLLDGSVTHFDPYTDRSVKRQPAMTRAVFNGSPLEEDKKSLHLKYTPLLLAATDHTTVAALAQMHLGTVVECNFSKKHLPPPLCNYDHLLLSERLSGEPLATFHDGKIRHHDLLNKLSWIQRTQIMAQLADILLHLHQNVEYPLVHMSANILQIRIFMHPKSGPIFNETMNICVVLVPFSGSYFIDESGKAHPPKYILHRNMPSILFSSPEAHYSDEHITSKADIFSITDTFLRICGVHNPLLHRYRDDNCLLPDEGFVMHGLFTFKNFTMPDYMIPILPSITQFFTRMSAFDNGLCPDSLEVACFFNALKNFCSIHSYSTKIDDYDEELRSYQTSMQQLACQQKPAAISESITIPDQRSAQTPSIEPEAAEHPSESLTLPAEHSKVASENIKTKNSIQKTITQIMKKIRGENFSGELPDSSPIEIAVFYILHKTEEEIRDLFFQNATLAFQIFLTIHAQPLLLRAFPKLDEDFLSLLKKYLHAYVWENSIHQLFCNFANIEIAAVLEIFETDSIESLLNECTIEQKISLFYAQYCNAYNQRSEIKTTKIQQSILDNLFKKDSQKTELFLNIISWASQFNPVSQEFIRLLVQEINRFDAVFELEKSLPCNWLANNLDSDLLDLLLKESLCIPMHDRDRKQHQALLARHFNEHFLPHLNEAHLKYLLQSIYWLHTAPIIDPKAPEVLKKSNIIKYQIYQLYYKKYQIIYHNAFITLLNFYRRKYASSPVIPIIDVLEADLKKIFSKKSPNAITMIHELLMEFFIALPTLSAEMMPRSPTQSLSFTENIDIDPESPENLKSSESPDTAAATAAAQVLPQAPESVRITDEPHEKSESSRQQLLNIFSCNPNLSYQWIKELPIESKKELLETCENNQEQQTMLRKILLDELQRQRPDCEKMLALVKNKLMHDKISADLFWKIRCCIQNNDSNALAQLSEISNPLLLLFKLLLLPSSQITSPHIENQESRDPIPPENLPDNYNSEIAISWLRSTSIEERLTLHDLIMQQSNINKLDRQMLRVLKRTSLNLYIDQRKRRERTYCSKPFLSFLIPTALEREQKISRADREIKRCDRLDSKIPLSRLEKLAMWLNSISIWDSQGLLAKILSMQIPELATPSDSSTAVQTCAVSAVTENPAVDVEDRRQLRV